MSDLRTPLPTTKRMRRCLRLWAIKLVLQEVVATSRIVRLRVGYPSAVVSEAFKIRLYF